MPPTRRGKGAAATGSSGTKAATASTASSGTKADTAATGSSGKKAATAASSGEVPMVIPVKGELGSTRAMMQRRAAALASRGGASAARGGAGAAAARGGAAAWKPPVGWRRPPGSDSSGKMMQKKAAAAASSRGAPTMDRRKGPSGLDSSGGMLQKKAAAVAWSGGAPTMEPQKGLSGSDSSGGMLQKKAAVAASSGRSAVLGALHRNTTAQDLEESEAKHRTKKQRTVSSAKIPHEPCTQDKGDIGLSGGMLQSPKVESDTVLSGDMLPEHLAEEADTAKGIKESVSNEIVHAKEEDTHVQEVDRLIEEMNAARIGEQISDDAFLGYFNRLARNYCRIDLRHKLEDNDLDKQDVVHALYRLRYLKYQFTHQTSKEELPDKLKSLLDKSEDDCNQKFLEKEGFFRRFEKDMTLDWFIHPDYEECSSLTDYQRLVLQNYGYGRWSEYHKYLKSYKTEKEYVKYCEELSKKLKWMEDYADIYRPSLKWDYITSRGAYQAIKIAATDFHELTLGLAYNGYYECKESMSYDSVWFKEYDGLYFEIWRRVTQKSISFEDALQEVYKLNMFPLRQRRMKGALECDYTMKRMETEYQTCTKAIASGDTEDKARKLIAEAVKTRVDKPKSYEQYIRKKIDIACIIGILPEDEGTA